MIPGLSQIPPKSSKNRSKSDIKRLQGLFGHYFRSHIEKSWILHAKKVAPRRPRVPRRGQNWRKIGSNFNIFPNFFSMWFSKWFRSHFAGSEPRKSCSRLGETLIFAKSWVSKKVSKILEFEAILETKIVKILSQLSPNLLLHFCTNLGLHFKVLGSIGEGGGDGREGAFIFRGSGPPVGHHVL